MIIPREILEKYDLSPGGKVFLQETPDGVLVSAHDPLFLETLAIARDVSTRYHDTLRTLSRR